jgi:hypothetical protein
MPPHRHPEELAPELQERIEEYVERFEEAWHRRPSPCIEHFLPADAILFRPVLVELVHVDLEYRLKSGKEVHVESYLRRYPELADERDTVVELLAAEFQLRRRRRKLTIEEFLSRFPEKQRDAYNELS